MTTAQAPQPTPFPGPCGPPPATPHPTWAHLPSPLLTNQCPLYHLVFPGHGLLPTVPSPGPFSPNQSPEVLLPFWILDSPSGAGSLLSLISSRAHYLSSGFQQDFAVNLWSPLSSSRKDLSAMGNGLVLAPEINIKHYRDPISVLLEAKDPGYGPVDSCKGWGSHFGFSSCFGQHRSNGLH